MSKCLICKKDYIKKQPTQKYCSKECRLDARYKAITGNIRRNYQRKCPICKITFVTTNSRKKYCSNACKVVFQREKNVKYALHQDAPIRKRFEILSRDNFQCQYCGRSPKIHGVVLEIDHIFPKSKGGTDDKDNLTTSCVECNRGKSDLLF